MLSAVTHHLRLTLDQVPIVDKSNEIPALKPLLRRLAVPTRTLATADAMHCQQESARFITREGAPITSLASKAIRVASRRKPKPAHPAAVLASLRNLAIGVYELERERGRTAVDTLKSWCQQQTFSTVWPILQR